MDWEDGQDRWNGLEGRPRLDWYGLGRVHTTTNQIRHPGESGARGQDSSGPELSGSGSPGDKREQALARLPGARLERLCGAPIAGVEGTCEAPKVEAERTSEAPKAGSEQTSEADQTFMAEGHDLMGGIPNYTNMKPSSRLARPWASAGPLNVEAPHAHGRLLGAHRSRPYRVVRH